MEHESDDYTNWNWCSWINKGTGGLGNKRTSGDYPNDSNIEDGQDTEKRPGGLGICCHLNSSEKPTANADVKKLYNNNNNNNNNNDKL